MEANHEEDDHLYQLLEKIRSLFKRENLCHNTYIYKKMYSRLTIPLSLITEEISIAKISKNEDVIIEALEYSKLVQVFNRKEVKIIQYPTVKINTASHEGLRELERILQEKDVIVRSSQIKYEISKRFDTEKYINLTVFEENTLWLEKIITNIDKEIDFEKADLMQDIKFGVNRIKKLKVEHAKKKTTLGKVQYSLNSPPEIFIRKALESSSSDEQQQNLEKPNGVPHKNGKSKEKRKYEPKKYKKPKKARVFQQDFPSLA